MTKTLPAALATHLGLEVASIATLWQLTRVDGTVFYFTDHDNDIVFEDNTYVASVGYNRTAVSNNVGLSVDNLDVTGFLDSTALTEAELRAGLFDKAEVRISLINWASPSDGVMRMRRGELGEVLYTDEGGFETELRGLTQQYSQQVVELYQAECRADLGDSRCKVTLFPNNLARTTAYAVGDTVRYSDLADGLVQPTLLVPGDVNEDDISANMADGTLGSEASISSAESKFGGASILFDDPTPTGTTNAFVQFPDIATYTIGASEFTIEAWIRFVDLTDTNQVIASHYDSASNERAWHLSRAGGNLRFFVSDDGTSTAPAVTIDGAFSWVIDTWYHVAVSRDSNDDIRLFVDGTQVGSTTSFTPAVHNSTAPINLGRFLSSPDHLPFDGYIDDFRFTVGSALYTAGFSVPTSAHPADPVNAAYASAQEADYHDRFFICTVAGSTAAVQPTYNLTPGQTTVDGAATFQAVEAFVRAGVVSGVTDNRIFSMTFPNNPDTREVADWFKYGQVGWETGNNAFGTPSGGAGLRMEVKQNEPSLTTGALQIDVDDTNTFSRSTGSFIDDGFLVGMTIRTTNFTDSANNGVFTIQTVNALTLDIVETTLVAETGTGDETIVSDERITLFLPMPFAIQVGDTFSIYAGCDKRLTTCINKFTNVENFRGEPYVPGQDKFLRINRSG